AVLDDAAAQAVARDVQAASLAIRRRSRSIDRNPVHVPAAANYVCPHGKPSVDCPRGDRASVGAAVRSRVREGGRDDRRKSDDRDNRRRDVRGPTLKGTIISPSVDWIVKRPDGSSTL